MIFTLWKWASFIIIIWFFYSKSFKNSFFLIITFLFFHLVRLFITFFVTFNINYQSNPHCHYLNLNLGLNPWYYWKGPTSFPNLYLKLTFIMKWIASCTALYSTYYIMLTEKTTKLCTWWVTKVYYPVQLSWRFVNCTGNQTSEIPPA